MTRILIPQLLFGEKRVKLVRRLMPLELKFYKRIKRAYEFHEKPAAHFWEGEVPEHYSYDSIKKMAFRLTERPVIVENHTEYYQCWLIDKYDIHLVMQNYVTKGDILLEEDVFGRTAK